MIVVMLLQTVVIFAILVYLYNLTFKGAKNHFNISKFFSIGIFIFLLIITPPQIKATIFVFLVIYFVLSKMPKKQDKKYLI